MTRLVASLLSLAVSALSALRLLLLAVRGSAEVSALGAVLGLGGAVLLLAVATLAALVASVSSSVATLASLLVSSSVCGDKQRAKSVRS